MVASSQLATRNDDTKITHEREVQHYLYMYQTHFRNAVNMSFYTHDNSPRVLLQNYLQLLDRKNTLECFSSFIILGLAFSKLGKF